MSRASSTSRRRVSVTSSVEENSSPSGSRRDNGSSDAARPRTSREGAMSEQRPPDDARTAPPISPALRATIVDTFARCLLRDLGLDAATDTAPRSTTRSQQDERSDDDAA